MTNEYVAGNEDSYLIVTPMPDGNVSLAIHLASNDGKVAGVVINPGVARLTAQRLTLASWTAEDMKGQAE